MAPGWWGGPTTLTLDRDLPAGLEDNTPLVFDSARLLTGSSGTLTAVAPGAGNYYVQVSTGDVYSSAAYDLTVNLLATVESEGRSGNGSLTASAADNVAAAADANNRLLENVAMTGALSSATDVDCWVFSTAVSSDFTVTFASGSTNTTDEWKIEITTADGAVLNGGSLTAGDLVSLDVNAASFPTGETFMVKVGATSSTVYNTSNYTLKVSGANLDLNDAPVLTVGGVSGSIPFLAMDSGVTRAVAQGDAQGIALTNWFSASDADAGQTVAYYRVSLTKPNGVVSDAVIEVGSGQALKTYGFAAGALASGNMVLTAAEMATAVFKPGTTPSGSELTLNLQAYDSTSTVSSLGGVDGSGASAIIEQSIRVVSADVGVTLDTQQTKLTLSENTKGEGSDQPHSTTFTLVLGEAPTADVKVYLLDPDNQLDLAVGGESGELVTFTSANWDTAQTVTVTATADSKAESTQVGVLNFTVVSTDVSYDGFSISPLSFTIVDNAAPVLSQPSAISYTDTAAKDVFDVVTGELTATDANADVVTYGVQGGTVSNGVSSASNDFGTLAVNTSTGAYTFTPTNAALNAAAANASKTFTVTASDGGQVPGTQTLTVSVVGVNDKPSVSVGAAVTLIESGGANNGTSGTASASSVLTWLDAEETTASLDAAKLTELLWTASANGATYTKVGTYGTATLTVGTATLAYALNDGDADTQALKTGQTVSDSFTIGVKDSAGLTNTAVVQFSINGVNDFPSIASVGDRNAALGDVFTLDLTSYVSDPEGDAITIAVKLENGDDLPAWLSFNALTKTLSGTPALANEGTLKLQITASDGLGTTEGAFNLAVVNAALEAVLRLDQAETLEDQVLSGNVLTNDVPADGVPLKVDSFDIAGLLQYQAGEQVSIPNVGTFVMQANGDYTLTPVANYYGAVPQITYSVNLEQGGSTLDIEIVSVNDAPAITSGATATVAENTAPATVIYTATASDVDANDTKSYSLAGTDASLLAIDSSTGAVSLKASANYEAKSSYNFDVVVTDAGELTGTQAVTLSVTDVNEAPTAVALTGTTTRLAENTSTTSRIEVATIAITDDALGDETVTLTGSDAASFEVDAGKLYLKAGTALNIEAQSSYTVTVNVADATLTGSTPLSTSLTLSVTSGIDINIQAHAWNTPTAPLVGVSIVATGATLSETLSTDATGKASLSGVADQSLSLTASLSASSAVSQSVNLTDAIAILKLIVGLPVNAGGAALSPYQALAADFDGNGSVQLTDAIGVLKHVVGLQAPKPEWRFVDEANADIAAIANHPLSPGQVPALDLDLSQAQAEPQLTLVGLIAGDVNGSFGV
jgi:VCBS repeat-containing protein